MTQYILDTRLSDDHYVVCSEAIRRGVIDPEDLNEGRRTMPEQWAFYRHQPPLAAFPSPNAPHIWAGRNNHAVDSNSFNGATQRLAHFYRSLGITVAFNAAGENWHFQPVSGAQLRNAANRIRQQRDNSISRRGEREKRIRYFKHQLHFLHDPSSGKPYFAAERGKPKDGWDTFFSPELEGAVKDFQADHRLKVDGVIGPTTDRAIDQAYSRAKRIRKSAKLRAKERSEKVARGEQL